jgi:hypothetical protein
MRADTWNMHHFFKNNDESSALTKQNRVKTRKVPHWRAFSFSDRAFAFSDSMIQPLAILAFPISPDERDHWNLFTHMYLFTPSDARADLRQLIG